MGWTGITTKKTFEQVFEEEFRTFILQQKIIKSIFLEVPIDKEYEDEDEHAEQFIAFRAEEGITCVIIIWKRYDNEVLYKEMDETVGPSTYNKCPKEIMDMLSPLDNFKYSGYAKEWRNIN